MNEKLTNFSLSIQQKLEVWQIIDAIEKGNLEMAKERAKYLIVKAKENATVSDRHKLLLTNFTAEQILDAAAASLVVQAAEVSQ
jgi:hypothetical protein